MKTLEFPAFFNITISSKYGRSLHIYGEYNHLQNTSDILVVGHWWLVVGILVVGG